MNVHSLSIVLSGISLGLGVKLYTQKREYEGSLKVLKEDYENSVDQLESKTFRYLSDKYEYGFIVFGILDGKFIYKGWERHSKEP